MGRVVGVMIVLALGQDGPPLSRVLTQVRRSGLVTRDELIRLTGLSSSGVARAVTSLVEARLLRERPDVVPEGTVGRPSVPVEINTDDHLALGVSLGRRTSSVSLGDVSGRVVLGQSFPTPSLAAGELARVIAARLLQLRRHRPGRTVVGVGLVAPWDGLDLDQTEFQACLRAELQHEVTSWELIPAIAAAEYLARPEDLPGSTLYVYSRDTVGFVMANQRAFGTEIARVGRLSHLPIGGSAVCRCGRTGCLETVVSDVAILSRARAEGITGAEALSALVGAAEGGDTAATELLLGLAETLGRAAAIARDITHPDHVVLCGQGFTAYPAALEATRASFFASTATKDPVDVTFTRFVGAIQPVAAITVALRRLFDDPASHAVMARSRDRHTATR